MEKVHFIESSNMVHVELPDGRMIEGPVGTSLEGFLSPLLPEFETELMGGIVDGLLKELSYPIRVNSTVQPILLNTPEGWSIYRRSLVFLLAACFEELFPEYDLNVQHALLNGGIYCCIQADRVITEADIRALSDLMKSKVAKNKPIRRQEIPLEDGKEIFRRKHQQDKLDLMEYRVKNYLTVYQLDDFEDCHYGYMLPSAGYLKWFELQLSEEENHFFLRFPDDGRKMEINPRPISTKTMQIFRQYSDWEEKLHVSTISSINRAISEDRIGDVVLVAEALHNHAFMETAYDIQKNRDRIKAVLIAGPSSSGKTTSSKRLSIELLTYGLSPVPIEMDNFFRDNDQAPLDEDGKPDFESIRALNTELLQDCVKRLTSGERVQMPHFNFHKGKSEPGEWLQLKPDQILILEGIHGLNPALMPAFTEDELYRIFVAPMTQVNMDRYNRISTVDVRLLRRIVRDIRDRGKGAKDTIASWQSVRNGENKNIIPYQDQADRFINTSLVYELSALKTPAEQALRMVPFGCKEYIEAKRLLSFLEWVRPLDLSLIPGNSLMMEFIGGSNLKNFTSWTM